MEESTIDKDEILNIIAYLVYADIPFLCGKHTMELLESKLDTKRKMQKTKINGHNKKLVGENF